MNQSPDLETSQLSKTESQNISKWNLSDDIDRRVSVLEERTKPKPKSFVEHITQWGGVATFLLALLYTFPLGVWDRFFVSPVEKERALIAKLIDIDTEYLKISQTLPMDQMLALTLSVRAKKTALLLADKPLIMKWQGSLSGPETELLAYHAHSVGELQLAQVLYETSLTKAKAEKDSFLTADIYRMRGQLFAAPGTIVTSAHKARTDFAEAVEGYINLKKYYPASLTIWDWASFENSWDSKACAYFLAQWAIQIIAPLDEKREQIWTQSFEAQRVIDTQANTLPTGACEKENVRFIDEINLINASSPPMSGPVSPVSPSVIQPKEATSR
jgi:hypothetical protein